MRVLFDDSIDAEVFANSAEAAFGSGDQRLSERIRSSAFVVPVSVVTVTEEHGANNGRLELELLPVERPLYGNMAPYVGTGETIKVRLSAGSSAYAVARSAQTELVGKRMNLCWAQFADGADVVEHWHALSDSPRTKTAISKAAAIVNLE